MILVFFHLPFRIRTMQTGTVDDFLVALFSVSSSRSRSFPSSVWNSSTTTSATGPWHNAGSGASTRSAVASKREIWRRIPRPKRSGSLVFIPKSPKEARGFDAGRWDVGNGWNSKSHILFEYWKCISFWVCWQYLCGCYIHLTHLVGLSLEPPRAPDQPNLRLVQWAGFLHENASFLGRFSKINAKQQNIDANCSA